MRPEGGRPRRKLKNPPSAEQLAAIASGEAALGECTHADLRPVWIDEGPDASCPLCHTRTPHQERTHYLLLDARVRRLRRGHPSKVRLAERAYRKATGLKWPIERTLWHEVVTERKTVRELATVLGVCYSTVAAWCRRIGIQDPDGDGQTGERQANEWEDGRDFPKY